MVIFFWKIVLNETIINKEETMIQQLIKHSRGLIILINTDA